MSALLLINITGPDKLGLASKITSSPENLIIEGNDQTRPA
jgi:hypothetical protein